MRRARQRGVSGLLILAMLMFVVLGVVASYALTRVTTKTGDRGVTMARLNAAAEALEQYAAAAARLPCPADPGVDTGLEVQATAATCTFPEGTLPWRTIGMRRDDAFDAWGRKLSYRVYTGNNGSLTQPGGLSMVECDTVEPTTGSATAAAASLGGLCVSNNDPYLRSTSAAKFLAGKGLTLSDNGANRGDVAYVVVSHGASGFGAYTASGVRMALPIGNDERGNTRDVGTFTVRAFSDAETTPAVGTHFDDLLAYRTIPDLVKRISLAARDWPDTVTSSLRFDNPTVGGAMGTGTVAPGDLGTASLTFPQGVRVAGTAGGAASSLSYGEVGGIGGIGVGGFNAMLNSFSGEMLRIELPEKSARFAVTLNHFGRYLNFGVMYFEQVQITFYSSTGTGSYVQVGATVQKAACRDDGGLASFEITPAGVFDAVEIRPVSAVSGSGSFWFTSFLVSEFAACKLDPSHQCRTTLASGSNTCS